jgi:predicted RNA-binding Zn-ribbon protein involved in translation (DUF1610 family)
VPPESEKRNFYRFRLYSMAAAFSRLATFVVSYSARCPEPIPTDMRRAAHDALAISVGGAPLDILDRGLARLADLSLTEYLRGRPYSAALDEQLVLLLRAYSRWLVCESGLTGAMVAAGLLPPQLVDNGSMAVTHNYHCPRCDTFERVRLERLADAVAEFRCEACGQQWKVADRQGFPVCVGHVMPRACRVSGEGGKGYG